MLYNMRSVNSKEKQAELYTHLNNFVPDVLAMTETWLDESTSKLSIPNYDLVSRRDRPGCVAGELNHSDIAVYRHRGGISLTHLEDSELAERSWQSIHTNVGPLLLGLWYRPPGSPRSHIETLNYELNRLTPEAIGTIVIGDMNIWHKRWLNHSPANSPEGDLLYEICQKHGLRQMVRHPTRGSNLLDLVLANAPGEVTTKLLPAISDHAGVLTRVHLNVPSEIVVPGIVWQYQKADWAGLEKALSDTDWSSPLAGSADLVAERFTGHLLQTMR